MFSFFFFKTFIDFITSLGKFNENDDFYFDLNDFDS